MNSHGIKMPFYRYVNPDGSITYTTTRRRHPPKKKQSLLTRFLVWLLSPKR